MTAAPRQGFWCCSCTSTCTKKGIRPEKLVILDEPKLGLQQVGSGETLHRNGNAPETPVHCKSAKLPHWVKSRMKNSKVGNLLFLATCPRKINQRKYAKGQYDKILVLYWLMKENHLLVLVGSRNQRKDRSTNTKRGRKPF